MHQAQHVRFTSAVACSVIGAMVLAGCGNSASVDSSTPPTTAVAPTAVSSAATSAATTSPVVGNTIPRSPQASAEAAVVALLDAEKAGNHRASFTFLTTSSQASYPSPDVWATHRVGTAPITTFRVESSSAGDVRVLVEHKPAIDPFVGLQFAREHQTWHARKEAGGWLVDPDPDVEPVVPTDDGVAKVVSMWATAGQGCDETAQRTWQAVATLFGLSVGAAALCRATGAVTVSSPVSVEAGPQTAEMIAQYGPGIVRYLRAVEVRGVPRPFTAFVVPIGTEWRVIGVSD